MAQVQHAEDSGAVEEEVVEGLDEVMDKSIFIIVAKQATFLTTVRTQLWSTQKVCF